MGLLKCYECGNDVSEYADKCQNCGCPIDIIKNKHDTNKYKIIFRGDLAQIDITGLNEKISEDELNTDKLYEVLTDSFGLSAVDTITINDIFKFNNYKFPDNYQVTYDAMCESNRRRVNANVPKCPTCGSTNIQKISTTAKVAGAIGFGLLSKTAKSQFKCNKCGYKW